MRPYEFKTFGEAIDQGGYQLQFRSRVVHTDHWQGSDIRNKPEMATHEIAHLSFAVDLQDCLFAGLDEDRWLNALRIDIRPNLPWADDHFDERVCGVPINPGVQWAKWPYGHSAASFLDENGKFNHNYMERYWPKQAGRPRSATADAEDWETKFELEQQAPVDLIMPNSGINHGFYGDLADVVQLLARDPYTRQAYLPVWFPEDTGGGNKRAPCTLGYHFLMRENRLDIDYHIRSCDYVRHFRDDIYLTMRLAIWVLEECRKVDSRWKDVTIGKYLMHIGSLHLFRNDYQREFKGQRT
jgi:hypothetical protein